MWSPIRASAIFPLALKCSSRPCMQRTWSLIDSLAAAACPTAQLCIMFRHRCSNLLAVSLIKKCLWKRTELTKVCSWSLHITVPNNLFSFFPSTLCDFPNNHLASLDYLFCSNPLVISLPSQPIIAIYSKQTQAISSLHIPFTVWIALE